jgi:hypothetical protein
MKQCRETTEGWELCLQWKDHSTNLIKLKDIKNAYPITFAKYAKFLIKSMKNLHFAWWIPLTQRIEIGFLNSLSEYWLQFHKYGIEIPKSAKHALELDQKNGDN